MQAESAGLPADACCLGCGYALRGLIDSRCPECGRAFDQFDPKSFGSGPDGARAWTGTRPPGRPWNRTVTGMAALTLLAFAVPGSVFLLTILLFWVWLGVMCAWLVRLILGYCRAAARGASLFDGRDSAGRWLHSPIVAVTTILLVALQVPHYVTFFVSLPHMRWVAAQQNSNWFMGCAGVYPVKRIEYPPWGMQFLVFGGGFMDDEGFAYSPNGPPAPVGENYYSHFWGDWYVWTESW